MCFYLILFIGLASRIHGDIENLPEVNLVDLAEETLFVSLGSTCEPAHILRNTGFRKAAFPFDWIVSLDEKKVIELLEDDFLDFLNEDCLIPYEQGGALLNTYYHLEFLHEGDWRGDQYASNLLKLKPKYERRINRFRQLREHRGQVFFIRSAYQYAMTDPHRYYKSKENLEITTQASLKLYATLKKYFPKLNFSLLILNPHSEEESVIKYKKLSDNLIILQFNSKQPYSSTNTTAFKVFFNNLIEQTTERHDQY